MVMMLMMVVTMMMTMTNADDVDDAVQTILRCGYGVGACGLDNEDDDDNHIKQFSRY